MKTCVSCQFSARKAMDTPQGPMMIMLCEHPENIDPVSGEQLPCSISRQQAVFCGIEGKYWKKKEVEEVKGTEGKVIQISK